MRVRRTTPPAVPVPCPTAAPAPGPLAPDDPSGTSANAGLGADAKREVGVPDESARCVALCSPLRGDAAGLAPDAPLALLLTAPLVAVEGLAALGLLTLLGLLAPGGMRYGLPLLPLLAAGITPPPPPPPPRLPGDRRLFGPDA